jgi:hypothetical protein
MERRPACNGFAKIQSYSKRAFRSLAAAAGDKRDGADGQQTQSRRFWQAANSALAFVENFLVV